MKTATLTPRSVNSRNPNHTETRRMEENEGSGNSNSNSNSNSSYYPGCLKDANCSCPMCLDSINATLDLVPFSAQKTELTRLSLHPTSPSSPPSTPLPLPPPITKTSIPNKTIFFFNFRVFLRWVFIIGLVLGLEVGLSLGFRSVLKPRLSAQIVRFVAEESLNLDGLNNRLMVIQQSLVDYVDRHEVSSCHIGESTWKIDKDDLILKSRCVMHKSAAEEVVVWGWPLQTSGLLTAAFSSRSLTILSGRVTEWPEGKIDSVVRELNTSWVKTKWSASVVELEANSWIVEYKQNMFVENPSAFISVVELLKFKASRLMERMKRLFWVLQSERRSNSSGSMSQTPLVIPT